MKTAFNPTVYICTAVHNYSRLTEEFIKSISQNTYKNITIIIVDDGSDDDTVEVVKSKYADVILLYGDGNLWWTGGINMAIKKAISLRKDGDYILTINNDVKVRKNYIQSLIDASIENPKSIIGSIERDINTNQITSGYLFADWANCRWVNDIKLVRKNNVKVEWLTTKGTLFPIKVFEDQGLLNQKDFPHYGSDVEFTYKLGREGYSLLVNSESCVYSHTARTGISFVNSINKNLHISPIDLAFSRKSTVNVIDHFNLIKSICPSRYKIKNYYCLLKKILYIFSLSFRSSKFKR